MLFLFFFPGSCHDFQASGIRKVVQRTSFPHPAHQPCPAPSPACWLVLSGSSTGTENLVWASFKEGLVSKIKKTKSFTFAGLWKFETNGVISGPWTVTLLGLFIERMLLALRSLRAGVSPESPSIYLRDLKEKQGLNHWVSMWNSNPIFSECRQRRDNVGVTDLGSLCWVGVQAPIKVK